MANRVAIHTIEVNSMLRHNLPPFMARLGNRTVNGASRRCNVDTGYLRSSLHYELIEGGTGVRVGTWVRYAIYVHEGRGPVVPVRARALRFKPKGQTRFVFARRVRGYKGNPFLREAMEEVVAAL